MERGVSERDRVLAELAWAMRRLAAGRATTDDSWLVGVEPAEVPVVRRRARVASAMNSWFGLGPDVPWWIFGLRLGFWLLLGLGVRTAVKGQGWHLDTFTLATGLAEVGFRARRKVKARRRNARLGWVGDQKR
jgi:hypothetical protein